MFSSQFDLQYSQAVFLVEALSQFKGRRAPQNLSDRFIRLSEAVSPVTTPLTQSKLGLTLYSFDKTVKLTRASFWEATAKTYRKQAAASFTTTGMLGYAYSQSNDCSSQRISSGSNELPFSLFLTIAHGIRKSNSPTQSLRASGMVNRSRTGTSRGRSGHIPPLSASHRSLTTLEASC